MSNARGKGKGKKTPKDAKDVTKNNEEYETKINELEEEVKKNEETCNFVNIKYMQSLTFWELAKNQTLELDKEFRNVVTLLEDHKEIQRNELEDHKQKIRHALMDANSKYAKLKSLLLTSKAEMIQQTEQELGLYRKENAILKSKSREMELQHDELVKSLHMNFAKEKATMEKNFEKDIKIIETRSRDALQNLRAESERIKFVEINGIQERNDLHIRDLISNHEAEFLRMKQYYNGITVNCINSIKSLEENVHNLKTKLTEVQNNEKQMLSENSSLKTSNEKLQAQVMHYKKYQQLFKTECMKNDRNSRLIEKLNRENSALIHSSYALKQLIAELGDTKIIYDKAMSKAQQQAGMRNHILEKKLDVLAEDLETREAQILCLICALKADEDQMEAIKITKDHIEEMIKSKNTAIRNMKVELARCAKTNEHLLTNMKALMGHDSQKEGKDLSRSCSISREPTFIEKIMREYDTQAKANRAPEGIHPKSSDPLDRSN